MDVEEIKLNKCCYAKKGCIYNIRIKHGDTVLWRQ